MRSSPYPLAVALVLLAAGCKDGGDPEIQVSFGEVQRYNTSATHFMMGDTFGNCWGDDDTTYLVVCDSFFQWNGQPLSRNLSVHGLPDDPITQRGWVVNSMDFLGTNAQVTTDPDGKLRAWKGGPILCDGGSLYAMVNRQQYQGQADNPSFPRYQVIATADLLASDDHGASWRDHLGNVDQAPPTGPSAMFTSPRFNSPYFIEHGRNNAQGPAELGADRYVYAMSFDRWPNGDFMTLGRVPRGAVMDPRKWQVYSGPVPTTGREGLDDANWSYDHDQATSLIEDPGKVNYSDVRYNVALRKYMYLDYYYPYGYENVNDGNRYHSNYRFYFSDTPWGPWKVACDTPTPGGFYIPTAPSKWISPDGKHFRVLAAGPWDPSSMAADQWDITNYTMFIQDVTLTTR